MKILGIESSCDETAVALVESGRTLLASSVASQIDLHARYGGVVPELASRNHVVDAVPALHRCLDSASMSLTDIDAIAVTAGPGLVGSLLVGVEFAKGLAYSLDVPLVGVNHIEAHLMTPLLDFDGEGGDLSGTPAFPFVGLVVSGGHTHLFLVSSVGEYELMGATRDDAAGEAFDKVAKMLGLRYPGGVEIDRLARSGRRDAHRFPRAMPGRDNLEFSFSGLKTSVLTHIEKHGVPEDPLGQEMADLCASFQEAVVDVLCKKTFRAAVKAGVGDVVIAGGVSANSRLRERAAEVALSRHVRLSVPPLRLCTDNAAMVAGLGYHYLAPLAGHAFEATGLGASSSMKMGFGYLDDPRAAAPRCIKAVS